MKLYKEFKIGYIKLAGVLAITICVFLFVLLLVLVKMPNYYKWIIPEDSPMTWLESVLLYSCFLLGVGNFLVQLFQNLKEKNSSNRHLIAWSIFSLGFLYLCLDERFTIHERIRDLILSPRKIKLFVFFWTAPGDFILLLLLSLGLFILAKFWKALVHDKSTAILLGSAIFAAIFATLFDSFSFHNCSIEMQRLQQFIEEIFETFSMTMFFNVFFLNFVHRLNYLSSETVELED